MKKLNIVLALIIVFGAAAFFAHKLYQPASATTAISVADGAFSFRYPVTLRPITQGPSVSLVAVSATTTSAPEMAQPLAGVAAIAFPHFLAVEQAQKNLVELVTVGGHTAYKITQVQGDVKTLAGYAIPLEHGQDPASFILVAKYPNSASLSDADIAAIAGSVSFDAAKATALAAAQLESIRLKGLDARMMADAAGIRTSMESSWDKVKGYAGLCAPANASSALQSYLADIKHNVDATNSFACFADKKAYSVSLKLPSGSYFCIDSTGHAGAATTLATTSSCK